MLLLLLLLYCLNTLKQKRGKSWDDDPENGHPSRQDLFM